MGAASLSSLFNGERVVVLLYLSRVFFSVTSPLLFEALSLFLLSLAALLVEISAEGSQSLPRFKTRLGASSGIFLGAVTLPTVFLSRLIQMSRAFLTYDVNHEEIRYLNMQYWAVVICCFSVLLFLLRIRWQCGYDENVSGSWIGRDPKLPALFVVPFAIILISLGKYYSGIHLSEKLLWICYHGLASVQLIQYVIHSFPECASIGEALLVTGGLVLYFGDFLVFTAYKSVALVLPSKLASFHFTIARSEISTFIQGTLFGLLLLPLSYKFILLVGIRFTNKTIVNAETTMGMSDRGIGQSALFYVSFALLLTNASMWMQFVKDFSVHPLIWVFNFVFKDPLKRLALCMYWVFVICASVLKFYNISKHSKIERILLRKYYHLVAVLMFVPALLFQPEFLDLSFGVAMTVFLVLEMIRVWKIWPLGRHVHKFMNAFTDHRDSDILIVSHFSLLLGCALPKWMSSGFNDRPLAPFAGILSLGIGDTMASMVGHKYGVLRWSKTGKKTVEGTAAGITSVLIACSILVPLLASTGFIFSEHWLSLLIAVTISGLLEAYTAQLDNAFIPLVFYALLCL